MLLVAKNIISDSNLFFYLYNFSQSTTFEYNSMVDEFRSRKLEAEYPVIWADALYEKIRDNHRITSKAVMVIKAVNLEGQQEILAVEPMENESEETYSALFRRLQDRGPLCVKIDVA